MRFLYVTDVHGNRFAIERAFAAATESGAEAIVFGGDLTPKSVALRLAEYRELAADGTDTETESALLGGEVLPVQQLTADPGSRTYVAALQIIKRLNEQQGSAELAERLERSGSAIIEVPNQFYEFRALLLEQTVLEKLFAFFGDPERGSQLNLTTEEMEVVRDCIVPWLREYETTWDEQLRRQFLQRVLPAGSAVVAFETVAPSHCLEPCLIAHLAQATLARRVDALGMAVGRTYDHLGNYLCREIDRIRDEFVRGLAYRDYIHKEYLAALSSYSSIGQLINDATTIERLGERQAAFLRDYFLPAVRSWRATNDQKPVYAMLGNDDVIENRSLLDEAEQAGVMLHLGARVHALDDRHPIVGYGYVQSLPSSVQYRAWEKDPAEIQADLHALNASAGRETIWVIHQPPYGVLDRTLAGLAGSTVVRVFLEMTQPPLALFGHIHEAPRLAGAVTCRLGPTRCVNPGGEHGQGLKAVVIDTATFEVQPVT